MNVQRTLLILLSAAVLPFAAQADDRSEMKVVVTAPQSDYVTPQQLARETGLSPRQIRMLVGARTAFAEYRTSFDRTQSHFREAMGPERYQDFINGRPIALYNQGQGYAKSSDDTRALVADTSSDDAINP